MNRAQATGSAILALAVGAGAVIWHLKHPREATVPVLPASDQTPTNGTAALQETVNRLQAETTRLADSLATVNDENTRLQAAKQRAGHAAQLFKELAEQSSAQNLNPTNSYPTKRHVFAGIGKQARMVAQLEAKWGDVDEDQLPPEEQQALKHAEAVVVSEQLRLVQVIEQMKDDEKNGSPEPITPAAMADFVTCYLYGALELDPGEFSTINGIFQKYYEQATQDHLLETVFGDSETATNRVGALEQMNNNATRGSSKPAFIRASSHAERFLF